MPRSMTGFGRAAGASERYSVEVEARSLNNRYIKVRTHTPTLVSAMEGELEALVRKRFSRGAIDIWVKVADVAPAEGYRLDGDLLERYRGFAEELSERLGIEEGLTVSDYLSLPGVITSSSPDAEIPEELREILLRLVGEALDAVERMREQEGALLSEDIARRADVVERLAGEVSGLSAGVVEDYRDRLLTRVNELLSDSPVTISEENILREVSIFAERSDISEELARIDSHLKQLSETLASDGEVGRKLEFVAQELHREVNTIGSKANDAAISRLVVDIKGEIDKIREQSQNLE